MICGMAPNRSSNTSKRCAMNSMSSVFVMLQSIYKEPNREHLFISVENNPQQHWLMTGWADKWYGFRQI